MAMTKDDLHHMIDDLPDTEVHAAGRYIQFLRNSQDPFMQTLLNAPLDDERQTDEELEGANEAWQEYLDGEARPWVEVRREIASDK